MKKQVKYHSLFGLAALLVLIVFVVRFGNVYAAPVAVGTDALESWAWVGMPVDQTASASGSSSESVYGFIHLNCMSDGSCDAITGDDGDPTVGDVEDPYVTVDFLNCTGGLCEVDGWAWMGTSQEDSATGASIGWLNFDPLPLDTNAYVDPVCLALGSSYYYPGEPCYAAKVDEVNQQELLGWARFETLADYGDTVLGTSNGDNDWGWVLLSGTTTVGSDYGLLFRDNAFEGWAYSGGGTIDPVGPIYDNSVGLGWLDFSNGTSGSVPGGTGYIATEYGDVYSRDGITGTVDTTTLTPSQYNATFLILGSNNSIVNFNSEYASVPAEGIFTEDSFAELELPDEEYNHYSQLGRLDLDKLTTVVSGSDNVYGDEVISLSNFSSLSSNEFLGGKVIVLASGDQTIVNSITFTSGTTATPGSAFNGSGTFVIDGDLTIDANMFYDNASLYHLKNLPSVAWIVRGDLTITSDVTNVVGSFFVIGDDTVADDGTITTEPASSSQLKIYGLMMAHGFLFQRTYEGVPGIAEPAEFIYYDGRVIANTPPGLKDYTSVLPIIHSSD